MPDTTNGDHHQQPPLGPRGGNAMPGPGGPHNGAPPLRQPKLPYLEGFVGMSLDALAQVELASGAVLWANERFRELTIMMGSGDMALGLRWLHGCFMQNLPRELHCVHTTIEMGGSGVDLWSVTQCFGPTNQEVVLWLIHQPLVRLMPQQFDPPKLHPSHGGQSNFYMGPRTGMPDQLLQPQRFPKASEHTDPQLKVMAGFDHCNGGKGRRPVLLLWHKYGRKSLYKTGPDGTSQPSALERLYYKCYQSNCRARLKIDISQSTGEKVSISASGMHNHLVELAE
eukprot:TRINITY_DN22565_c0_g1_i3.p1 TRINITY_DN22565_c0_g1~~TRINITY_DN22565_c0_g1_i3.p1  ORF type:complete len:283 (+),score=42.89 TRINITY_DN22565_c0_g1_i3:313-1161(+)